MRSEESYRLWRVAVCDQVTSCRRQSYLLLKYYFIRRNIIIGIEIEVGQTSLRFEECEPRNVSLGYFLWWYCYSCPNVSTYVPKDAASHRRRRVQCHHREYLKFDVILWSYEDNGMGRYLARMGGIEIIQTLCLNPE